MNHSNSRASSTPSKPDEIERYPEGRWDLIPLKPLTKVPRERGWMDKRYARADVVRHVTGGGNAGVRLRAGQLVVDVDPRNFIEGDNPWERLCKDAGIDPDAYPTVNTGSGGLHVYMLKPADVTIRQKLDGYEGIDFKSVGGYVVAAGSVHPVTGRTYEWDFLTPPFADVARAPERLLVAIARDETTGAGNAEPGEIDAGQLASMLDALDVEDFRDYSAWLGVMMASHHGTASAGREEFITWSIGDPAYAGDAEIIGQHWDSLRLDGREGMVTARTLYRLLVEAGREDLVPRPTPQEDFDVIDGDEALRVTTNVATSEEQPIHVGGLSIHNKTRVAPDTPVNALRAVHASGLTPRFDELKQRVVFSGELPWDVSYGRELNDQTARMTRLLLMEIHQGNDYQPSKENVLEAAMTLAYAHKFNPIHDYLDRLEWDGTERVERLFTDGFMCADDEYTRAVSRCFMVGAVARQRSPGCKLDTMPVIKGPQGSNKSSGLRDLFSTEWFSDSELGDLRNKDAPMQLDGIWVHEFAELAGLRASDMDVLKAFMSRATDRYRVPYGRTIDDHPRRAVFAGTVNEGGYLSDPTGGRRFWPLEMRPGTRVDLAWIAANRDQLWAEAEARFHRGEAHVLPEALWPRAAEQQAAETVDDPWADEVRAILDRLAADYADWALGTTETIEEIVDGRLVAVPAERPHEPDRIHTGTLLRALELDGGRQNRSHTMRLRRVMEALGWRYRKSVRIGEVVRAGYISPTSDAAT
nr:VapE domain-containing protein [Solirhodobacter olei]